MIKMKVSSDVEKFLEEFSEECLDKLLIENPKEFKYPDNCYCSSGYWPVDEIKALNEDILSSLKNDGNVYAIYIKNQNENAGWIPVYVGQRKSAGLRGRITDHLIKKGDNTGSKLEEVKKTVADSNKIAISYIKVEPESLRLYIEETIIVKEKAKQNGNLRWNTHG